ncbi:hypothetical protein BJY54_006588 [Streptomyces nodosus]|uniref:Uncharacterized protein n=1 Tax=Streptomyces nodosus TaxID=40318 RepID=A0A0B5DKR8_9ACTN|nr:hypothetical protein SNOD_33440 [Streptomyces nodosus]MBB4795976.1 hypothetical protein [Streptomyces nodosus]
MTIADTIHQPALKIPASAWTSAIETDGEVRDGAWAAELTCDILDGHPKGRRLIVRKPCRSAPLRPRYDDGPTKIP